MKDLRVLAFAREAGGAAALAPVLAELQPDATLLPLAKDYAEAVFREAGIPTIPFPAFSEAALREVLATRLEAGRPDVVLTSATSLPWLDMTEKYLWRWARGKGIPSVGVLDQWQNYALRFSGPAPEERLCYLPDRIAVMDEQAKRGMIADGIPENRLVITGQPALDRLLRMREKFSPTNRRETRQRIGVEEGATLICFVSEAFARDFGERLGYTEQTVLRELLTILDGLAADGKRPIHLAVKLHPQNERKEFAGLMQREESLRAGRLRVSVHEREIPPLSLVLASDLVIGMTSVLLVESILLGRPTVSFQPHGREANGLIATVVGAIPRLDNAQDCRRTIRDLLEREPFRTEYLRRQARLSTDGGAAGRVADLVRQIAGKKAAR